ncbi:hypothetical protein [Nocardia yamanashiensis]|uniref:hypothetical protein n=1 Tax=Nocardia yamanashiensis TaxID=209247 RepID=UPI000AF872FD|nr:hypothetical protein [Nocardia yamanashiensis]
MAQTRKTAVPNDIGSYPALEHRMLAARAAAGRYGRTVHLAVRVAPGLSEAALAELATTADQLRLKEGLPPAELTAQW